MVHSDNDASLAERDEILDLLEKNHDVPDLPRNEPDLLEVEPVIFQVEPV